MQQASTSPFTENASLPEEAAHRHLGFAEIYVGEEFKKLVEDGTATLGLVKPWP
jgi:hypothetical protein